MSTICLFIYFAFSLLLRQNALGLLEEWGLGQTGTWAPRDEATSGDQGGMGWSWLPADRTGQQTKTPQNSLEASC